MSEFPIRVLSELTGVPTTTLRAWERRYGLLEPGRTPKGHRQYKQADLDTVRRVVQLLEAGHSVSKAVKLVSEVVADATAPGRTASIWNGLRKRFLRAIDAFDDGLLDAIYNEALAAYPIDIVTDNLLRPVLQQLGERWPQRESGIAEEHFFTAYLRNKIGARMHHTPVRAHGRRLLLACLPGEFHELGALLFGLSALARGYRILYLGTDLPLAQVGYVAGRTHIAGVLLSGTAPDMPAELQTALDELAVELATRQGIPLLLGGAISHRLTLQHGTARPLPLGSDFGVALQRLEQALPAYGAATA